MEAVSGNEIKKFSNLNNKDKKKAVDDLLNIITNKNPNKKEALKQTQDNFINLLKADNNITIKSESHSFSANLNHTLRDIVDSIQNIFFKQNSNPDEIISKLKTLNNSKIAFALPLSMAIALSNQFINRKITKKQTGIDNFVGENGYDENVKEKNQKENQKGLWWKKLLSAGVFLTMLMGVMNIKKPKDLINKLEFTGPVANGNTIKTVYGTLILGRIFASKDTTELRETNTRDYLGFLNWLVLGGFVSKGVAQIFDPKKENLFNITKQNKGISHWLKDVQIKSQKEILAEGKNVTKNLRQLNIAQISGILYSGIMLGILLPKLNIALTKAHKTKKNSPQDKITFKNMSMEDYVKFCAKMK